MKAWLSREGVPFTARDVHEDDTAYDALLALGYRTVPLTLINGEAVRGFDEAALREAITRGRLGP